MEISEGMKIQTKKKHPCGSDVWEVIFAGSDLKLKCLGCGHCILQPRSKLVKNIKGTI